MKQYIWTLGLSGSFFWRLSPASPNLVPLQGYPGWSIITPFGYTRMTGEFRDYTHIEYYPQVGNDDYPMSTYTHLGNDDYHISTEKLWLLEDREEVLGKHEFPDFIQAVPKLLSRLRYVSKQVTLPNRVVRWAPRPFHASGTITEPELSWDDSPAGPDELRNLFMHDHDLKTAVTLEHLHQAALLSTDFQVPVHADVLLDALQAYIDADFRKSILYAAIAIESLATTKLAEYYEKCLRTDNPDPRLRIVEFPIHGKGISKKDPVYEALSSGDNFRSLLHEMPLYLLGRSLLVDDQETYRQALTLYKTRNKIAHRGAPPIEEAVFTMSWKDALAALEVAIHIFNWYGEDASYTIAKGMVSVADPNKIWIPRYGPGGWL